MSKNKNFHAPICKDRPYPCGHDMKYCEDCFYHPDKWESHYEGPPNYEKLLLKYMAHVIDCEHISFIDRDPYPRKIFFTPEEMKILERFEQLAKDLLYNIKQNFS